MFSWNLLLTSTLHNIPSKPRATFQYNPLTNDKILDMTKLKAFADEKLNIAWMTISLFNRIENTVEKGENVDYQHFSFPHSVFQSLLLQGH